MICFFCFVFFFVIGVGREIECVGATESTGIVYVSVRVICTIKLNIEENFKIWMLNFLGKSKYYLKAITSLVKKRYILKQEL